ncbi:hypothetical protein N7513_000190 [Penicillium frequentans]|nr:hypothetical protein N7513_000190 [Penicillium glabrum]
MNPSSQLDRSYWKNNLGPGIWKGEIHGVMVDWNNSPRRGIRKDAKYWRVSEEDLKAVTEDLAYHCALSLHESKVDIIGSIHDHTTSGSTGERADDEPHISLRVFPSRAKVHLYIDILEVGINMMQVVGQGVMQHGTSWRDMDLSWGILPPLRF